MPLVTSHSNKEKSYQHKICTDYLGEDWCCFENFSSKKLTGGLTNILYVCSNGGRKEPTDIVLRYFGEGKTNDIDQENKISVYLGENGVAPKIYGHSETFRLEEFITGTTLKTTELIDNYPKIARLMKKVHSFEIPIDKSGQFLTTEIETLLKTIEPLVSTENFASFKADFEICEKIIQDDLFKIYQF